MIPLATERYKAPAVVALLIFGLLAIGLMVTNRVRAATNADVNGDGTVDQLDLDIIKANYNGSGKSFGQGDLNGDGKVNVFDLAILAVSWGNGSVAGTRYYVDCTSGADSNNGTSTSSAWKSLAKANAATLNPGDGLFLKRGCTWSQQLSAHWTGTTAKPITIDAYGSGTAPLIQGNAGGTNGNLVDVNVTGSYQNISNLATALINPRLNTTCLQSDGTGVQNGWYPGFVIAGNYNNLSYLDVSSGSSGVAIADPASNNPRFHDNKVTHSHFHGLHALWALDITNGALGAMAVDLHGNYNEIAYNTMDSNGAQCTLTQNGVNYVQIYDAPLEAYNADGNYVHHNQAFNHRKHFEIGHDPGQTADNNVIADNLFVSNQACIYDSRGVANGCAVGPNIHGLNNPFGPVSGTMIYHNTIVFTGLGSSGLSCDCTTDLAGTTTTIRDNIFVGESKAAFYRGSIVEDHNLYWDFQQTQDASPDPFVQFSSPVSQAGLGAGSVKANPNFVNFLSDYHLQANSPAIDQGSVISSNDQTILALLALDLDGVVVPHGASPDMGAYEF